MPTKPKPSPQGTYWAGDSTAPSETRQARARKAREQQHRENVERFQAVAKASIALNQAARIRDAVQKQERAGRVDWDGSMLNAKNRAARIELEALPTITEFRKHVESGAKRIVDRCGGAA